ncbi:ABC transporter ATP-binding protein [Halobellus marinus]|uniref:ABC transporter ATP-binding protein n=1 Tax=Halobellus TaxID=1073986 RepID=UPI0028B104DB|nr:ABC transporter ATP-binding protein [Halobellus sp. DFY28]
MTKIQVQSLRKEFATPEGTITAVDDIDLQINEGEFFTLVGPSGCGKTTTLRCIAGLEDPTNGTIKFGNKDVTNTPPNKRELAMMFQSIALYPHMTITENIAYPLKIRRVPLEERKQKAADVAEMMQIRELLEKYPGELSGGQRQRAALARVAIQEPVGFLMDEPLSDLDAKLQLEIRQEIQKLHRKMGKPTLYVTHNQEEALTMSDRIGVMRDGNLEQVGTPEELYRHPTSRFVAEFIGLPSMNMFEATLRHLDESDGEVTFQETTIGFDVDYVKNESTDEQVYVGFRPSEATIVDEEQADLVGQVRLLEQIGDRVLGTLEFADKSVQITIPVENQVSEGDSIPIVIDRDGLYVFDSTTDELVAKGKSERTSPSVVDPA